MQDLSMAIFYPIRHFARLCGARLAIPLMAGLRNYHQPAFGTYFNVLTNGGSANPEVLGYGIHLRRMHGQHVMISLIIL